MSSSPLSVAVRIAALMAFSGAVHANLLLDGPDTFVDTVTGYEWLRVSTFYGQTFSTMVDQLPEGYSFATEAQLKTLTDAAPADPTRYAYDAKVMGVPNPNPRGRDLIWGFYGDGTSWAWKFKGDTQWNTNVANSSGWFNWDYVLDPYAKSAELGAFAVKVSAVPEPQTVAMLFAGLGLVGAAVVRRRAI